MAEAPLSYVVNLAKFSPSPNYLIAVFPSTDDNFKLAF